MYTGPRGGHKTIVQTGDMCRYLIRSYLLKLTQLDEPERIYSNYPVGFMYYPGHGLPAAYLKPEPLNMEALYVLDKGFNKCRIFIDEIDQWLDRQEWQTTTQRILSKAVQLIRKRKMSIHGTIQSFGWLNSKFQFQTDVICKCREAAFRPWGRERNLGLGEVGFTDWQDKSGVLTGYPFEELQREFSFTHQSKRFWNCYDTDFEFDPLETSTRYTLKRPKKEIVLPGSDGSSRSDTGPQTPYIRDIKMHSERKGRIDSLVADAVYDFREKGQFKVKTGEMFDFVNGLAGHEVDKAEIGAALKRMGIKKCGSGYSHYNLYPDEENRVEPTDDTPGFFAPRLILESVNWRERAGESN